MELFNLKAYVVRYLNGAFAFTRLNDGSSIIMVFLNKEDAERYAGLGEVVPVGVSNGGKTAPHQYGCTVIQG